jgi:hypothetical protein
MVEGATNVCELERALEQAAHVVLAQAALAEAFDGGLVGRGDQHVRAGVQVGPVHGLDHGRAAAVEQQPSRPQRVCSACAELCAVVCSRCVSSAVVPCEAGGGVRRTVEVGTEALELGGETTVDDREALPLQQLPQPRLSALVHSIDVNYFFIFIISSGRKKVRVKECSTALF